MVLFSMQIPNHSLDIAKEKGYNSKQQLHRLVAPEQAPSHGECLQRVFARCDWPVSRCVICVMFI